MAYNPEEDIKVSDLPEKTTDVVSDDKLLVIDSEDANILKQVDASKVGSGTGDMLKSVYDTNNNGIVDNAEALGGVAASDYAKTADTQAKLESGVNIKTINGNSILGPGNIEIQGGSGTVDTEMSDTSTNAVQNKVIKAYVDSQSGGDGTTKTFILNNVPELSDGQEFLDWYRSGKNPIVMYQGRTYYLTSCDPAGTTNGKMVLSTVIGYENSLFNTETYRIITVEFDDSDTVTLASEGIGTNGYLATNTDYSTPYTPLYDGSPATKKYVDDKAIKIFTLTGSYSSKNTNMTADDLATVKDACDFYLAGGFPIIKGAGDGYFFPIYISSNTDGTFRKLNNSEREGRISERQIEYRGSYGSVNRNSTLQQNGEYYLYQTQIDDLDQIEGSFWRGNDYMVKGIFQFTLTIKQGSTVKKRYNGIMVGDFNAKYCNYRYFSPTDSYTVYSNESYSGGQVFKLRDTTNWGELDCSIVSDGVNPFQIKFRNKNKSVSGNSLFLEGMIIAL